MASIRTDGAGPNIDLYEDESFLGSDSSSLNSYGSAGNLYSAGIDNGEEPKRKSQFQKSLKRSPEERAGDYLPGEDDVGLEMMPLNGDHNETFDSVVDTLQTSFTDLSQIAVTDAELWNENTVESGKPQTERSPEWECPELPVPVVSQIVTFIVRKVKRGINAWPELSVTKKLIIILVVLVSLGLLLFVSLFPASFVYVEYHEYAFSRNKVSWQTDYSVVYDEGCYLLSPAFELVRFQATAHFVDLDLFVTSSAALDIELEIMLQYFPKRNELAQLYKKYYFDYDSVIRTLVQSTVKNTAVHFSVDEFRLERKKVEAEIFQNLKYVLSGNCCDECCPYNCSPEVNCRLPNCSLRARGCYPGHHVEIKYFQLGKIGIPGEIMDRYMKHAILKVDAEREFSHQRRALVVKKTELLVKSILNEAAEVKNEGKAKERVIRATAESEYDRDVQLAYQKGLKQFFTKTNVTSQEIKCSFMLDKALEDRGDNLLAFNYDRKTAFTP